jgi:hypothetical protein
MTSLPTRERNRLAKMLALLGSDKAGEREAAAMAAHRLLQQHQITWSDLLARPPVKREPFIGTWRTTCAELAARRGDLRPWERKFVEDLPEFPRLSSKQRYVLKSIADRVLGGEAPT